MKQTMTSLAVLMAISLAVAVVWAGGMGGGMMGGGGHMMDSYGNQRMWPGQDDRGYYDRYHEQGRFEDRQREREAYDHDMQQLNREIGSKEGALRAELQKENPDRDKIAQLRQDLSEMERRYDRHAGFDND